MFAIRNTPRDYSWGSTTAIPNILGTEPTGRPQAELWLGDHPSGPARLVDGDEPLSEWGRLHPERFGTSPLPFLMKLLAAESPLSIQAHPTREQAQAGFARENAAGISVDAPERNYRDANHKPEIIIALTEFSALCGFRPGDERSRIMDALEAAGVAGARALRAAAGRGLDHAVEWLLTRGEGVRELVEALASELHSTGDAVVDDALDTAVRLAARFPGDPGIAVSLLLNHVVLKPGEALFLPAGNIHAYLHGVGIEVMATSDNVLRGGLTSKHIDVPELLAVLDPSELIDPRVTPVEVGSVHIFDPGIPDFAVTDVTVVGDVSLRIEGPAVALVTEGELTLRANDSLTVSRGESVFVESGETLLGAAGKGRLFVAHRPESHRL